MSKPEGLSDQTIVGPSETHHMFTGCGPIYITIVLDEERKLKTLFVNMKGSSCCQRAQTEAICRTVTDAIKAGANVVELAKNLRGITCERVKQQRDPKEPDVLSCADAIGQVMLRVCDCPVSWKHPSLQG